MEITAILWANALHSAKVVETPDGAMTVPWPCHTWHAPIIEAWEAANGDPSEYEESPQVLPDLTPRQFWLATLSAGITEEAVDSYIDGLDEPERSEAKIAKQYASTYMRDDPLIAQVASAFSLSQADVDALWAQAAAL